MNRDADSIRVVGEADLLELAGISRGTWNGWVKSEHVNPPSTGLFGERDVVHILALKLLAEVLSISKATIAWRDCEEDALKACTDPPPEKELELDLVVDLQTLAASTVSGRQQLFAAIHTPVPFPRGRVVMPLGEIVREARMSFWRRARPASAFSEDGRRRPAARVRAESSQARPR